MTNDPKTGKPRRLADNLPRLAELGLSHYVEPEPVLSSAEGTDEPVLVFQVFNREEDRIEVMTSSASDAVETTLQLALSPSFDRAVDLLGAILPATDAGIAASYVLDNPEEIVSELESILSRDSAGAYLRPAAILAAAALSWHHAVAVGDLSDAILESYGTELIGETTIGRTTWRVEPTGIAGRSFSISRRGCFETHFVWATNATLTRGGRLEGTGDLGEDVWSELETIALDIFNQMEQVR